MERTITIEVDPRHHGLVRRALAWAGEMEQRALTAPEGSVWDTCAGAVIHQGRTLQRAVLAEAVARRVEAAEKMGRRSAPGPADAARRTAGPRDAPR